MRIVIIKGGVVIDNGYQLVNDNGYQVQTGLK